MLTFAFMLSSLPCLYTFWHAIPTSFYIFNVFYFFIYIGSNNSPSSTWVYGLTTDEGKCAAGEDGGTG